MTNLYNTSVSINHNQHIYDAFNAFIFSEDRNIFNKLWARNNFYNMTKDLSGDIVECGVFKGSGLAVWLKLLDMYEPNSIKKVLGFDYFDPNFVEKLDNDIDKTTMSQVFKRCEATHVELSTVSVRDRLINAGFRSDKFDLIQGNISSTSKSFLEDKPGLRISILYLDLDLEEPTYDTLCNMWDRIVDGGVVVFDEYAYHNWSESNGVDRFIKEHNLKLYPTRIKTPTAYLIK
jgi:hypothetical protein